MAQHLDPGSITSAAEAFTHPLPQIRQLHRALATSLEDQNARLRALVGGSYRQLLDTAETILQMRRDMGYVDERLLAVGKGCGRSAVDGVVSGLEKLEISQRDGPERERLARLARLRVLVGCGLVGGALLGKARDSHSGMDLVLVAKVWVLGELLLKSLLSEAQSTPGQDQDLLDESTRRMRKLRKRLLATIERTLASADKTYDLEDIVPALCAYSLARRSGAGDVLVHFLRIRANSIARCFEQADTDTQHGAGEIVRAMQLYVQTMLDVQSLVPRRLSEALAHLKRQPLVEDEGLQNLPGLRMGMCTKWAGDAVLFFTPYIIHDDLSGPVAKSALTEWSERLAEVLVVGIRTITATAIDLNDVLDVRRDVLKAWVREGARVRGLDPSPMLDSFRDAFNARLFEIVDSRSDKLHLVATEIEATLSTWQSGVTDAQPSLWDKNLLSMQLSGGARMFKEAISTGSNGRNDAVLRAIACYSTWKHLVDEGGTAVTRLSKERWDDDLDDAIDEDLLEARVKMLSVADPRSLQQRLEQSVDKAFHELHLRIRSLLDTYRSEEHFSAMTRYMLRVIRDIQLDLPLSTPAASSFGLDLVDTFHETLAQATATRSLTKLLRSIKRLSGRKVPARALWEGEPQLPIQPTPAIFIFLRHLVDEMGLVGMDVWTPTALRRLQEHVTRVLHDEWMDVVQQVKVISVDADQDSESAAATQTSTITALPDSGLHQQEVTESGRPDASDVSPETTTGAETMRRDWFIQSFFDASLLQLILSPTSSDGSNTGRDDSHNVDMDLLCKEIASRGSLSPAETQRLRTSATAYRAKVNLLFRPLGSTMM